MTHPTAPAEVSLAKRGIRAFDDAAGLELGCLEGSLWVTLDGDLNDYVLEQGETFTTQQHGRAVVYALETSRLSVEAAASTYVLPQRATRLASGLRPGHA